MMLVDLKALDQRLRARIAGGIEHPMRLRAAPQEVLQPEHVAAVDAPDDHGTAGAGFEQSDAPQDQRPHDALAEACFLHHQVAEPWSWYDERLDLFDRPGIDQRRPRRQLRQLA